MMPHLRTVAAAICLLAAQVCVGQDAQTVLAESKIDAGLAIHIGATDGALEAGLAESGRILVHALAADDAARDRTRATIAGKGCYGLASAITWHGRPRLPYASNLANLVILDRDAMGAKSPEAAEVQRVLAPYGVLYERSGGAWKTTVKPRPAQMDDWSHFDYGPEGNPCSLDTAVKPVRQLQWITQAQPNPFDGNPAGYDPGGGVRIWQRYAVLDMNDAYTVVNPKPNTKVDTWSLQCRDAFNGTPLWTIRRGKAVGSKRWSLVATDGLVFTYLKPGSDLVAIDIATGQVKHSYPGTAPEAGKGLREEMHVVRVSGKTLVVSAMGKLLAFETATGKPLWTFDRKGTAIVAPAIDAAAGRVYALVAGDDGKSPWSFNGRWPVNPRVQSVVAIDLATGKPAWENSDEAIISKPVADENGKPINRALGQIVPAGKFLVLFGSAAISGGSAPFVGSLDAATGRTLHTDDKPFQRNYNVASYNLLVRNGTAYFAGAFMNIWAFHPETGKTERQINYGWNQRCTRLTATSDFLVFGQTGYYKPDLSGEQITVARSGCAIGNFLANGMTYFTANACGCITQLRGFSAMTGDDAPAPLPDAERLLPAAAALKGAAAKPGSPAGEVAADWTKQWRAGSMETEPVTAGDMQLVAVMHQHRLEARANGAAVWSFVADGRISSPPVVVGETAVFGDHAGWVYGVSVKTGDLRWKYLVAPSHRLIGDNAQLSSSWPVYGVAALPDGDIIASAGTHAGVGGGVVVAAISPGSGKAKWRKTIALPPNAVPVGGGRGTRIVDHTFVNSVPRVVDGQVVLGDGGRKGDEFRFDPSLSEAKLVEQLLAPKPKK